MISNLKKKKKKHSMSWPFHEPVSKEEVPDYYVIISDTMGLI